MIGTRASRYTRVARRLLIPLATMAFTAALLFGAAGPASAAPPQYGSGHGLCFDLNSRLAADSLKRIGRDSQGGTWSPVGASTNPLRRGCDLDWMLVNGNGIKDATYQSRVLLFHGGRFIGTVEPRPYSYTSIAGYTKNSVSVRYRWLKANDPFCCASGGPTTMTAYEFFGYVFRIGAFPPKA